MIIFFCSTNKVYFSSGTCGKGDRCKFSHDLEIERKAEKRSLYCDVRDDGQEGTSEDWDEEKLKEVVEKKHAEADKKKTKTDIVIAIYYLSKSHDLIVFVFRFANTFWTP